MVLKGTVGARCELADLDTLYPPESARLEIDDGVLDAPVPPGSAVATEAGPQLDVGEQTPACADLLGLVLILFFAAGIWLLKKFRHIPLLIRIRELAVGFAEGLRSIGKMENAWAFVFHSIFIWGLYYTMTYVAFFAFAETAHLGLMAGLVVFVFGSIGMVMPLPGGIGSYHSLVRLALSLYAVPAATAAAFATAIHAGQTFGIILFGFLSLILLPIINGKKTVGENENA